MADLEEELVRIGGGHLADRAARRAADAEVVRRLRQVGFKGPLYDTFMEQQMRYGWSVLNHWCASGEVFARARAFGRPVPDDMIATPWLRDDRHEVAAETTIAAARLFRRHALLKGAWAPEGGASLTSFFVGACLLCFKAEYQRWYRRHRDSQRLLAGDSPDLALAALPDQRAVDPLKAVVLRERVEGVLERLEDPKVKEALVLRAAGFRQSEAALHVGLTTKALESRVGRARAKLRGGASDTDTD
ncbi:RNA polymerase sigma factor [Kitasatospora phosalacinea]|uniref:RNA polymerase sigma factor n=1 Tax=Kitasatospora phosalacinea TaxID=2065 RepID=UPI000AEDBCF1|nr:hypothetical protein [Kitasatospora phosalacinea]